MNRQIGQTLQHRLLRRASEGAPSEADRAAWEKRAPGWQVRCTRCGFTEPWGKYGIRLAAASWKKYTVGRCAQCGRFAFHAIERARKPASPAAGRA